MKKIRIFITGGLGNQLFQLAAALHFANGRKIELDVNTAIPRKNSEGVAEFLSLNLPKRLKFIESNKGDLVRHIYGFNLRSGYLPTSYEKLGIFRSLRNIFSSVWLSILLGSVFRVKVAKNLGYDPEISKSESNDIIIGYFQTYLVTEELLSIKDSIFADVLADEFSNFQLLADKELPLLVHVRLGDYLNEDQFGVLSAKYYETAITAQWKTGRYKKIWLFSDQPNEAIERIPKNLVDVTRVIHTEHLESAETMRIMTLCHGYIIANSTFSWWAAYLRVNEDAPVIAPKPWFVSLPEPLMLVPLNWDRISAFE